MQLLFSLTEVENTDIAIRRSDRAFRNASTQISLYKQLSNVLWGTGKCDCPILTARWGKLICVLMGVEYRYGSAGRDSLLRWLHDVCEQRARMSDRPRSYLLGTVTGTEFQNTRFFFWGVWSGCVVLILDKKHIYFEC